MQKNHIYNNSTSFLPEKSTFRIGYLMVFLMFISLPFSYSFDFQDEDPLRTAVSLTCTQIANGEVLISAKLKVRIDKQYQALPNAEVEIYNLTDSVNILLEKKLTDENGIVELLINAKEKLQINEDGYFGVMVSYEGDDKYKSSDSDLLFKSANLEMTLSEEDSIKTITVSLIASDDDETSLEDVEVFIKVPRMFSDLTIASDVTNEDGVVEFEFPNDLPGGENGELSIIASVDDSDDFASLKAKVQNNWGVPVSHLEHLKERQLWSPDAPLWMVLTFLVMIGLVWGHFMVIIYKLFLIKKEGKSLV
jgi:hypothetical protein